MKQILMLVMIAMTLTASAQKPKTNKDSKPLTNEQRIDQRTQKFIRELYLTDDEAKAFIPIYKEYAKEMQDIRAKYSNAKTPDTENERKALTEAQIEERILAQFKQSREILNVREQYYQKFRTCLSPRQISRIYSSEKKQKAEVQKKSKRTKGYSK